MAQTITTKDGQKARKKYCFLFSARDPWGDIQLLSRSSPRGAELADGILTCYWGTESASLGTAINRAKAYLAKLQSKVLPGACIDWEMDDEYVVTLEDGTQKTCSFPED